MAIGSKSTKMKWHTRILAVAAVSGGFLAVVWYQLLAPVGVEIAAGQEELREIRAAVAKAQRDEEKYAQFKAEAPALERQLESLRTSLPLEKETGSLLRLLEDIVAASGIQVLSVVPRPPLEREVYLEWPIDMEIAGSYHDIAACLDQLRRLPRIVNVGNLRIRSRPAPGGAGPAVGATLVATTFIYREEESAPRRTPAQ
jgi:type IV pilus assembly protein PilO